MRIMVDINIVISAMIFKSSKMNDVLKSIIKQHELCVASYTIEEAKYLLNDKFSSAREDVSRFFDDYPYTLIEPIAHSGLPLVKIRDEKDYPVLHAAITGQVDILITGDKDFFEVKIDRPEILHPLDYLEIYPVR